MRIVKNWKSGLKIKDLPVKKAPRLASPQRDQPDPSTQPLPLIASRTRHSFVSRAEALLSTIRNRRQRNFQEQRLLSSSSSASASASASGENDEDGGSRNFEPLRQNLLTIHTLLTSSQTRGARWYVGQWVDVKDTVHQWLEATVIDIATAEEVVLDEDPEGARINR